MSDDSTTFELSRRKVLAGLGGIGLASAGAGLGTSAYLNDTETFENNTITAGELDLKVDWEEHYSYPQIYGNPDPTDGLDVRRSEPDNTDDYVGLPDPEDPMVWVHEDDLDAYMDNTSIEAFPDPNGDGIQEMEWDDEDSGYVPCKDGADVPEHMDPTRDVPYAKRTKNDDTWMDGEGDEEGSAKSLVALEDVKPGDFGELTLSFHLCDNPGYVWLQGALDEEGTSENGVTEPEGKADAEGEGVELLDQIQTVCWYDHSTAGNNVIDTTIGKADVIVLLDRSGSLNESEYSDLQSAANDLVDSLLTADGDVEVGGLTFGEGDGVDVVSTLGTGDFDFAADTPDSGNNTPMPHALDVADQHLDNAGRSGAEQFIILLSDGGPNYVNEVSTSDGAVSLETPRAADWSADSADQAYDNGSATKDGNVTSGEREETSLVADNIKNQTGTDTGDASHIITVGVGGDPTLNQFLRDEISSGSESHFESPTPAAVSDIISDIVEAVAMTEEIIHRGTLRDTLNLLESDNGVPIDGDLTTSYDELEDPADSESRDCFMPGVNHFVGFAWWLPTSAGNEVQSDSVSFDLGFYTEQCRNNDGAGGS